jgi:hypothetical protein
MDLKNAVIVVDSVAEPAGLWHLLLLLRLCADNMYASKADSNRRTGRNAGLLRGPVAYAVAVRVFAPLVGWMGAPQLGVLERISNRHWKMELLHRDCGSNNIGVATERKEAQPLLNFVLL